MRSTLLWITAIILTLAAIVFQRMTGPTHPVRGEERVGTATVSFKLIRSWNTGSHATIKIIVPDTTVKGMLRFRRFKSHDTWTMAPMHRSGDTLTGLLPSLPPAGKMMYLVSLNQGGSVVILNDQPVVLRYKGSVPGMILITHIIFIFLGMLLSTRAGLEALFKGRWIYLYTWLTAVFLFLGGLIFGPIIQKYAFGAYWTGWPVGSDLTDNKSMVAFLFWIAALALLFRKRDHRLLTVIASVVTLVVFLIPHSLLGSEIDYTQAPQKTELPPSQP